MRRCGMVILTLGSAMLALAPSTLGSQLIDRNPHNLTLQLNSKGEALLSYSTASRGLRHVLAWGGRNAIPPQAGATQVEFQLDYTGGYGKYFKQNKGAQALAARYRQLGASTQEGIQVGRQLRTVREAASDYWQSFRGGCGQYDGPKLEWARITCKAPDGSYWAVQEWQRELPDYGVTPTPAQSVEELRLSHWTGPLAVLTIDTDWAYPQHWDQLFGTFTYLGQPVYGFHATSKGNPTDSFGRNVYIDTYNSIYGTGWRRENSALSHKPTGAFCYDFVPEGGRSEASNGSKYQVTLIGPGVTPDITWTHSAPGPFDASADTAANDEIAALNDPICKPN